MLTVEDLRDLIHNIPESDTVDFKQHLSISNDGEKASVIKDILSMANTPRTSNAYIIVGVKLHPDSDRTFHGVDNHVDDADLHSILNRIHADPKPKFAYYPVMVDGKSYGVIEVPVDRSGPFVASKEFAVVRAKTIYFRRGSQNDEATVPDQRNIYKFFQGTNEDETRGGQDPIPLPNGWDEFIQASNKFKQDRLYVLVIGPEEQLLPELWSAIGRIPISLVVDFDPNSQDSGAYRRAQELASKRVPVHLITLGDSYTLLPFQSMHWLAARGLTARPSSIIADEWRAWNRSCKSYVSQVVVSFVKASKGMPVTIVCSWSGQRYVETVCEILDEHLAESANFVFCGENASAWRDLADKFDGAAVAITPKGILQGVLATFEGPAGDLPKLAAIPSQDGTFQNIDDQDLRWIEEDVELLHTNIEAAESVEPHAPDFLRGASPTWREIGRSVDAARDKSVDIVAKVEADLKTRQTARQNLYHWPGAGGTTVSRRLAWDLHRRYPCALLKRVTPSETIERLAKICAIAGHSLLLIFEGAEIPADRIEHLYSESRSRQLPVTFLCVSRRFEPTSSELRSSFLQASLNLDEGNRFYETYSKAAPGRGTQLAKVRDSQPGERTPFLFALTAFGTDFVGLHRYVRSRLEHATAGQVAIMTFLALAYHYGHRPVVGQVFANHLGEPGNRPLYLTKHLNDSLSELLIQEANIWWRPIHNSVAESIVRQSLAGVGNPMSNWKAGLTEWATNFIKLCRNSASEPSEELIDLLRRVFVQRDENEGVEAEGAGSKPLYAAIIEDTPTNEGKLITLKTLAEAFPDQAHFWAHLGRFYSYVMEEHVLALAAIDRAVAIDDQDPVLYHIKGMCLRRAVYTEIKALKLTKDTETSVANLQILVTSALAAFGEARTIQPDSEHSYISAVEMIIKVLDSGFETSNMPSRSAFLSARSAEWYRDLLDLAETLLEDSLRARQGDKKSGFVRRCEADIRLQYDDYSQAIQGWNNLVEHGGVFAPPLRRQIARAITRGRSQSVASLPSKDQLRIAELMEQNMTQEPTSEANIRMWFSAIRHAQPDSVDRAIDKMSTLRSIGESLDSYFYLYVLHVIKAIEGSTIERVRSADLIEQCRQRARAVRYRHNTIEFWGNGHGLGHLVSKSDLGEWSDSKGFYEKTGQLRRLQGVVKSINDPGSGVVEIRDVGLEAFFIPSRIDFKKGRDENRLVSFILGFSYDGLITWSVEASS
jgi:hypothetical protein